MKHKSKVLNKVEILTLKNFQVKKNSNIIYIFYIVTWIKNYFYTKYNKLFRK